MNRKIILLTFVLMLSLSGMLSVRSIVDHDSLTVFVVPWENVTYSHIADVGDDFNVLVAFHIPLGFDFPGLYAWQFTILFDPTILQSTGPGYPPGHVFDSIDLPSAEPDPIIDNEEGYVKLVSTLVTDRCANETWCREHCTLAQVNFIVVAEGVSALNLSDVTMLDCPELNPYPVRTEDSFIDGGDHWHIDGDVNGDGEVGISDLWTVARHFGEKRGNCTEVCP